MKHNLFKRIGVLAMTAVMALSMMVGVSAANESDAIIDTSRKTSLTLFKYDMTSAESDGAWSTESYVSTGIQDDAVNTALSPYAVKGVEFTYVRLADVSISHFQYTPEGSHVKEEYDDAMDWTPGTGLLMTSSILMIALFIIGAGMIAAAGAVFVYQVRKPKANPSDTSMDYVEEYEALERPGWRLFHRKRREQHPDYQGAMKVRYAFQTLLRNRMKQDPIAYTKTPNELRKAQDALEDELIDAYNRVRYGDGNVTQGQLEKVEKWLQTKNQ